MSARLQALVVALGGVVLVWIVASALSRAQGIYPFGAGIAALCLAALAHRRGHRTLVYVFLYVLVLAAGFVLAFEAVVRVKPGVLKGRLANVAYSGYHWHRGGIYRLDEERGPVLRASVRRWIHWNGHWWRHEANADGYRGPRPEKADAAFVGDSMIYGHGVSEGDTLAARFTALTGRPAANLGQQGIGLVQGLGILREHGPRLRPSVVFVFSHPTDPADSLRYFPEGELRRFLATPPSRGGAPPRVREEYRPPAWWNPRHLYATHLAAPLYVSGLLGTVARRQRGLDAAVDRPAGRDPFVPTPGEIAEAVPFLAPEPGPEGRLAWETHRRAVAEMTSLAATWGGQVVLLDLGYPEAFSAAIESLAAELQVPYSPAGRVALARSLAGGPVYLADDGHWTGAGAALVAAELASYVR